MATQQADKRTRLIHAAEKLVYKHGFNETTLADIAKAARVPLGNMYYYFRSKDALGSALVEKMDGDYRTMLQQWEKHADPRARVAAFIQLPIDNCRLLARSGCPIGSLCTELHKESGALTRSSTELFAQLLTWLEAQFRALGKAGESRRLAVHVLSVLQGASLLTHSFGDPQYIVSEAKRLQDWVRTMR